MNNNQDKLSDLSSQMVATNLRKDYAEFLDLASHELDSPLRKLTMMIEKMADKFEKGQIDEARLYQVRVQSGLQHMRSMVDALYQLTQLNLTEPSSESCDLREIIRQLAGELQLAAGEKLLTIRFESLPVLVGDRSQLKQLVKELLQNSIRFSGEAREILVNITSSDVSAGEKEKFDLPLEKNYSKLEIRDNGIGFSIDDARRIFEPFVRLHGRSEYPGSGIGLTICQKIVNNHHGIIYAEPNENSGSGFHLILPQSLN